MALHLDVKAASMPRLSRQGHPPPRACPAMPPQRRSPLFVLRSNMMRYLTATLAAVSGLWLDAAGEMAPAGLVRDDGLGDFIAAQSDISLRGVLANIGPRGSKVAGAAAGVVVASPSKKDPDYFYTWTRDAALTLKVLIEDFAATGNDSLRPVIQQYVSAQAKLQDVSNPSGGPSSGGLGEPKFH
ncbi:hypothetical protein E4U42_003240, partial [Claviceps africana]